jgi:protein SCO1/2
MKAASQKAVNVLIALLIAAVIGGIAYWFWWGATKLDIMDRAANWTLDNVHSGQRESFYQAAGDRVKLVEFIYINCPDICPATTLNMTKIQEELKRKNLFGSDVVFVGVTFDPTRDTPEVINDYAKRMKVDWSGWQFYRGSESEIQNVLTDYKIFAEKTPDGFYIHPTRSLFLVDRENNIRKIYNMGETMDNAEILKDIVGLTKE